MQKQHLNAENVFILLFLYLFYLISSKLAKQLVSKVYDKK